MRTRIHPQWRRNGVHLGAAMAVAGLGLVATATPALAHANVIIGTTSCPTVAGAAYQVTWSVSNDWNLPETAHVTFATGGSSTLAQTWFAIPASGNGSGGTGQMPYKHVTVVQTLPQSVSGTIFLNLSANYSDNFSTSNSGEITAPTNCPTAPPVTPAAIAAPAPVSPAIAATVSPTTIPASVPSVAQTPVTIPTPPPANTLKIANSISGSKRPTLAAKHSTSSGKHPTLLASSLPPAKPQAPVTKAATFTG